VHAGFVKFFPGVELKAKGADWGKVWGGSWGRGPGRGVIVLVFLSQVGEF